MHCSWRLLVMRRALSGLLPLRLAFCFASNKPPTGAFSTYTAQFSTSEHSALYGLLVSTSGEVWVTILAENVIARLDVAASRFIYYRIPAPGSLPLGLAMDAHHNLWFTGVDKIGTMHP